MYLSALAQLPKQLLNLTLHSETVYFTHRRGSSTPVLNAIVTVLLRVFQSWAE